MKDSNDSDPRNHARATYNAGYRFGAIFAILMSAGATTVVILALILKGLIE